MGRRERSRDRVLPQKEADVLDDPIHVLFMYFCIRGMDEAVMNVIDTGTFKYFRSREYNYNFDRRDGHFARWGKALKDDPQWSPYGPEILDLECSTICSGLGKPCPWCYKSNGLKGKNMSIGTFKKILDKMPETLTQVAFGIGSIGSNPDLEAMFDYCRSKGIIPNITINGHGLLKKHIKMLLKCGAVAVSSYRPKDVCYDAVKRLKDAGHAQINIHKLLCDDTYNDCLEAVSDHTTDDRLVGLNAIVFLLMKPKGKRNKLKQLRDFKRYKQLVSFAMSLKVPIGFDSCSAPHFTRAIQGHPKADDIMKMVEPCESGCFSSYINVDGKYFHCSFTEGEPGWEGIDVVNCKDFLKDVWYHPETERFRKLVLDNKRACHVFDLTMR